MTCFANSLLRTYINLSSKETEPEGNNSYIGNHSPKVRSKSCFMQVRYHSIRIIVLGLQERLNKIRDLNCNLWLEDIDGSNIHWTSYIYKVIYPNLGYANGHLISSSVNCRLRSCIINFSTLYQD